MSSWGSSLKRITYRTDGEEWTSNIEEDFIPHGCPEDAAALNAGFIPHDFAGV